MWLANVGSRRATGRFGWGCRGAVYGQQNGSLELIRGFTVDWFGVICIMKMLAPFNIRRVTDVFLQRIKSAHCEKFERDCVTIVLEDVGTLPARQWG